MRTTVDFFTVVGQSTYTIAEIFGPSFTRFGRWNTDFFFVYDGTTSTPIRFVEYDVWIFDHINDSVNTNISTFTVDPSNNSLLFSKPDQIYTIKTSYYKSKQILAVDSDIPELPEDYHNVIIYDAVARYALNVSLGAVYQLYSQKFVELYDDLVRSQLPKEKFRVRGIA